MKNQTVSGIFAVLFAADAPSLGAGEDRHSGGMVGLIPLTVARFRSHSMKRGRRPQAVPRSGELGDDRIK